MPRAPKPRTKAPAPFGESFSFGEIVQWTNATRSNLIHWTNIGIVTPDIADTAGPGYARRFSLINLVEVQAAAELNRFRLPAALIGDAIAVLRDFHERCLALTPAGVGDELSSEQRLAVERAYLQEAIRRDTRRGRKVSQKKQAEYRQALSTSPDLFSDEHQRSLLHHARTWAEFRSSQVFRNTHFYGLFVSPDGDEGSLVADEPLQLHETIGTIAIVINLGALLDYTQAVCGGRL